MIFKTEIIYFGERVIVKCDKICKKAWGRNGVLYDENDNALIPEGDAPENPGTYEGSHGKPVGKFTKHNKWCVRECERSELIDTKI